ncbi:hypothetical protein K2X33_08280, partial [bacterium]|nr:hypothetical protein [bacterium]
PEGLAALKGLGKLEGKESLFDQLYLDFLNKREAHEKYTLSAGEILEDLNAIGQQVHGTKTVSLSVARAYLKDTAAYCKAAKQAPAAMEQLEKDYYLLGGPLFPPADKATASLFCQRVGALTSQLLSQSEGVGDSDGIRASLSNLANSILPAKWQLRTLPENWKNRYWDYVELVSPIFHQPDYALNPIFYDDQGQLRVATLNRAPTEDFPRIALNTSITASASRALARLLSQKLKLDEVKEFWPDKLQSILGLKIEDKNLQEPLAWLNSLAPSQIEGLYNALQPYFSELLVKGGKGSELVLRWQAPPQGLPTGIEAVVRLGQRWFGVSESLRTDETLAQNRLAFEKGLWRGLARALVQTFLQSSEYRLRGDDFVKNTDDANFSDLTASLDALEKIAAEPSGRQLQGLADRVADILSSTHELKLVAPLYEKRTIPGLAFFFDSWMPSRTTEATAGDWADYIVGQDEDGLALRASAPMAFVANWAPKGAVGTKASEFTSWFDLVSSPAGEKIFEGLKNEKKESDRVHVWEVYPSLQALKADANGAYSQVEGFLRRWDANAQASKDQKTYAYFLALMNWNINHYGKEPRFSAGEKVEVFPEAYVAYHLSDALELLGLPLDNFEGWKNLVVDPSKFTYAEWAVMAQSKRALLTEVGRQRFLSGLIDAPKVENPYWGASYNYRPFPIVDEAQRSHLAPSEGFGTWFGKTQDYRYTELYGALERNSHTEEEADKVPLYQQLVADSLEMQGEHSLKALDGKSAGKHTTVATQHKNWKAYFEQVLAMVPAEELVASLEKALPNMTREQIIGFLQKRGVVAAFASALSEFQILYPEEGDAGWKRFDLFSFQSDINSLVTGYKDALQWKEAVPFIDVTRYDRAKAHRQGIGMATYVGAQMANGVVFDQNPSLSAEAEKIFKTADAYYREQVQADTYTRGLLSTKQNNLDNIERLCKVRTSMGDIQTEEKFKEKAKEIEDLRLPLMDGLFQTADQLAPPGAGDKPRQMLRDIFAEQERAKQSKKDWEENISYGMLALLLVPILVSKNPALARLAATSPGLTTAALWASRAANGLLLAYYGYDVYQDEELSVSEKAVMMGLLSLSPAVNSGLGQTLNWWMGLYWANNAYSGYKEDFVENPRRAAETRSIRDTVFVDAGLLMSDDSALLTATAEEIQTMQRVSTAAWIGRTFNGVLVGSMVVAPIVRWAFGGARTLLNARKTFLAGQRQKLEIIAEQRAQAGLKATDQTWKGVTKQVTPELESRLEQKTLELLEKRIGQWTQDGKIAVTEEWKQLLLEDVRRQIEMGAQIAEVDAVTLAPLVGSGQSKRMLSGASKWLRLPGRASQSALKVEDEMVQATIKFQNDSITRLTALRQLETKLLTSLPHVAVDDLRVLLVNSGSPLARHTPWFAGFFAVPTLNPKYWRLRSLYQTMEATDDLHRSLGLFYGSEWAARAKPVVKEAAKYFGKTEGQVLQDVLENNIFAGPIPEMAGPYGEQMMALAKEFRAIHKLGHFSVDAKFLQALGTDDVLTMINIAKNGRAALKDPVELGKEETSKTDPAPTAPAAVAPVQGAGLDALLKGATVNPMRGDAAAYRTVIEAAAPRQIEGVAVDAQNVLRLTQNHSYETLQDLTGIYMRRGLTVDSTLAELRLAQVYRRAMELEASATQQSLSVTKPPTFEEIVRGMGGIEKAVTRPMNVREARSLIEFGGATEWTAAQVRVAARNFANSANGVAVETATQKLTSLATTGFRERRFL